MEALLNMTDVHGVAVPEDDQPMIFAASSIGLSVPMVRWLQSATMTRDEIALFLAARRQRTEPRADGAR